VEKWASDQATTRSDAIRRLVELGLKATINAKKKRPDNTMRDSDGRVIPSPARSTPNKVRAAELAAKTIDKMIDPAAGPEERNQRRRRLTKGPTEFRENRVDLPKQKR
jgi:hypothetical protein